MARKAKVELKDGQVMRVRETGALVELEHREGSLVDKKGYVYVRPVTKVDDWYHIDELESVE